MSKDTTFHPPLHNRQINLKSSQMRAVEKGHFITEGELYDSSKVKLNFINFKRKKTLVVKYWATWCGPCISTMPEFIELSRKYRHESNIEFITVSIDDLFIDWKEYVFAKSWNLENYWIGSNENNPLFHFTYNRYENNLEENIIIALPKYIVLSPERKILENTIPSDSILSYLETFF